MKLSNTKLITAALLVCAASAWTGSSDSSKTHALPIYTRRFGVSCDTCHTVAPALNSFGLAFQANHFNWPDGKPPQNRLGLAAIPISGLATYSSVRDNTFNLTTDQFDSLELFASTGFKYDHGMEGGYFVDYFAGTGNFIWGELGDAFVSVPVAGPHGEAAVTVGQFSPMMYQYDALNSLPRSIPAALSTGADAFSLTSPLPGVRLEYFDARGRGTANGDYLNFGVPFTGELTLSNQSQVDGPRGYYADAFRRQEQYSYGLYAYRHDENHTETLIGTYAPCPVVDMLAAAGEGHDITGSSHEYSLQADYIPRGDVGVTARLESTESAFEPTTTYPVFALTYYPGRQNIVRVVGQTIQNAHDRTTALFLYGQF